MLIAKPARYLEYMFFGKVFEKVAPWVLRIGWLMILSGLLVLCFGYFVLNNGWIGWGPREAFFIAFVGGVLMGAGSVIRAEGKKTIPTFLRVLNSALKDSVEAESATSRAR